MIIMLQRSSKDYLCEMCYEKIGNCTCGGKMVYVPERLQEIYRTLSEKKYSLKKCEYDKKNRLLLEFDYPFFIFGKFPKLPQFFTYDYDSLKLVSEKAVNDTMLKAFNTWCELLPIFVEEKGEVKGKYNSTYVNKEFGEHLVMFQLMSYKGWDVENVDYVGVDLIAIDKKTGVRYAIQVKLRHFSDSESSSNSDFTYNSEKSLRSFANAMSTGENIMIPLVAFVNIGKNQCINTVIVALADLIRLSKESYKNGLEETEFGYRCNTGELLNRLLAEDCVTSYRYYPKFKEGVVEEEKPLIKDETCETKLEKIDCYTYYDEKDTLVGHGKVQMGTFGEWYYMLRSLTDGYHPFLIQSEGVDILKLKEASIENQISAVSIKTFSKREWDSYNLEIKNEKYINEFCDKWSVSEANRLISLQFLIYKDVFENNILIEGKKDYYMMYTFEMTLDYLVKSANNENIPYIYISKKKDSNSKDNITGYTLNWKSDNLDKIMEDDNISFNKVYFGEPKALKNRILELKLLGIENKLIAASFGMTQKDVENMLSE